MARKPTYSDAEGCHDGVCRHDGSVWIAMCARHQAECDALHVQAHADYLRTQGRTAQPRALGAAEGLV